MRSVRILISGKVQGVFFRKYTCDEALRLGLRGYVKNLPDGRVQVEVSGEPDAVEALISWCKTGPPRARVTDVQVTGSEPADVSTFVIRR